MSEREGELCCLEIKFDLMLNGISDIKTEDSEHREKEREHDEWKESDKNAMSQSNFICKCLCVCVWNSTKNEPRLTAMTEQNDNLNNKQLINGKSLFV